MDRASGYACPLCGSYLRNDKPGKLYCHCGFERKTLNQMDKEIPPKSSPEEPIKFKKKR